MKSYLLKGSFIGGGGGFHCIQRLYTILVFAVSMWIVLPAVAIYTLLGAWLLNAVPKSFTLGEAMIVAQGLTLLFLDAAIQLLNMVLPHEPLS